MSREFKRLATREIEEFKAEYRARFPGRDADKLTDEDLLREVMNTVGKPGKLGEHVKGHAKFEILESKYFTLVQEGLANIQDPHRWGCDFGTILQKAADLYRELKEIYFLCDFERRRNEKPFSRGIVRKIIREQNNSSQAENISADDDTKPLNISQFSG